MTIPRLLNEVLEGLAARPEIEAIAIGGSRGTNATSDTSSDWDVYVYLASPLPIETRESLLAPRSTVLELGNEFWEPEDDGQFNDGTDYELIYRNIDQLRDAVSEVVEGHKAGLGYTTCLWHNLLGSRLYFDRGGRLAALQARFDVSFPEGLRRRIIEKNWPLLSKALPSFRNQVARAVKRSDWVSVQHRTAAFLASAFDLIFAANGKSHPGEKRLVEISSALPRLPSDWKSLLGTIDRAGQGARVGLVEALDRMATAVEVFLIREGLLEAPPTKVRSVSDPVVQVKSAPVASSASSLTVYTDGGCIGNPGKGAWAYLIDDGKLRVEDTGGESLTTNNKMELQAVIEALSAISQNLDYAGRPVVIYTDSQYVRNGITTWIKTWSQNGWKTAAKEPVKNQELWMELQKWDRLVQPQWKWVKGHAGNANNERCDALVRRTMEQL